MSFMNRFFVSDEGGRTAIQQPSERMAFPFPVPLHHYPIEGNDQKVILGQNGEEGGISRSYGRTIAKGTVNQEAA